MSLPQKSSLFISLSSFLLPLQKKEPKKMRPEKTTMSVFRLLRNAIFRSKKQDMVRTFSGFPSHVS
jgi:hypothetical protein